MADLDDLGAGEGLDHRQDEGVLGDLGAGLAGFAGLALPEAFRPAAALGRHQPGLAGPGLEAAHQALGQVGGGAGRGLELQDPGAEADGPDEAFDIQLEGDVPLGVDQGDQVLEGLEGGRLARFGLGDGLWRRLGGGQGPRCAAL